MIITHNIRLGRIVTGTWKNTIMVAFTCSMAFFLYWYFIQYHFEMPAIVPSILGTALAFFIGFNNNQAYDRWWEARKIWGSLVNSSRTWARNIILLPTATEQIKGQHLQLMKEYTVKRHIAFLYALKEKLRGTATGEYKKYLIQSDLDIIKGESNKHNAILSLQTMELKSWKRDGLIDGFEFLELNAEITRFCDEMGKSERIKNTVFPTTYNYYTKMFIWLFNIAFTLAVAPTVGWRAIVFGTIIGYVFHTIHFIGQSIVNPFEPIPMGIPLDQITRTIEINLLEMIHEEHIPAPVSPINDEYVM
ncbi:bestrophin family protein [Echinicola shivajiensis]|uniref:bestrophin family protein n=1 Tax=Echinicola shivajiensis TaxID=1035916 RepID=UPI001BFCC6A2|nr:bestrophin family ion channel [Echinicola shivajiensis]